MKIFFLLLLTTLNQLAAKDCREIRMAFDFGSTAIKMAVAEVDFCETKILDVILRVSSRIDFQSDLYQSKNQQFSRKILWKALNIISDMHQLADSYKPKRSVAVGTSVFRKASNSIQLSNKLEKWFKLPLIILSPKQKGRLSFEAVRSTVQTPRERIAVWEIGASSMQFTSIINEKEPMTFEAILASVSFKNMFMDKVQMRTYNTHLSPNPISMEQGERGLSLVEKFSERVPAELRQKLADSRTRVYGIGGVHSYSISKQVNMPVYNLNSVKEALNNSYDLSDSEIGGEYADTEVSNLILVAGFLKNLNISQVYSLDISMVNGLLVSNQYW